MQAHQRRIVVIGDLNAAADALEAILLGTGLIDRRQRWRGGQSELVQLGDIFNRGGGARRAFNLLSKLKPQAERAGGRVTVLLGNHEAMVALRHEGYCTEDEYLSFATAKQRRAWPQRVERAARRLLRSHGPRGPILPLEPRLSAWKLAHVPGRSALRSALSKRAPLGRTVRGLPVVYQAGDCVFVHGGLLPAWAALGVVGLNALAAREWQKAQSFIRMLPKTSIFRADSGPLWDRSLALGRKGASSALVQSLALLGARRMIVGHTPTEAAGGKEGRLRLRFGGRLVLTDVGLQSGPGAPRTALLIEGHRGYEWTPSGKRLLWTDHR